MTIPKYTKYELSAMVKLKRKRYNWHKYYFCKYFKIDMHDLKLIEECQCAFSPKLYKICAKILGLSIDELLEEVEQPRIDTKDKTYLIADYIFQQIIMQKKIRAF